MSGTQPVANTIRQHAGDVPMLVSGAAVDVATVWAVERWVTPRRPKLARWLFLGGAVGRAWLVAHNLRTIHSRRQPQIPVPLLR